jgi:hypothetical protein
MTTKAIILDTDIGTDVDDCLALALCLASSELKLTAVTTVYGDVRLRSRMVLKLLALRGVDDVPVAAGAEKPLLDRVPVFWEGHEGQGVLTPEDSALAPVNEHAADLIARTVMARPGEIILIAIGPLTNVALAMLKEPRLARALGGLVIMGGVIGGANAPRRSSWPPARRWRSCRWMRQLRYGSGRSGWHAWRQPTRRSMLQWPTRSGSIPGTTSAVGPICTIRWPSRPSLDRSWSGGKRCTP